MIGGYEIVYLVSSLLGIYARYKLMQRFYEAGHRKGIDFASYIVFYIVLSSVYLFMNIPILTFITNIGFIVAIAYSYKKDIKKAIFAMLWMMGLMLAAELIVVMLTGYILVPNQLLSQNNYESVFGPIFSNILIYILAVVLNRSKRMSNKTDFPINYWIAVVAVPVSSLYFMMALLRSEENANAQVVIMSVLVLGINFSIFTIYDSLIDYFAKKAEVEIIDQQNKSYIEQIQLMRTIEENIHSFQHDMNKHVFSLRSLAEAEEKDRILNYLDEIEKSVKKDQKFISSGNVIVDSIINYEISKVDISDIEFNTKITSISEVLDMEDYDLTIILSNLLNNAFEAVGEIHENRQVEVEIDFNKSVLMIHVSNTYDGVIKESNGSFTSTKKSEGKRGFGIKNVERVVEKYEGQMLINHEDNVFDVKLMMYL